MSLPIRISSPLFNATPQLAVIASISINYYSFNKISLPLLTGWRKHQYFRSQIATECAEVYTVEKNTALKNSSIRSPQALRCFHRTETRSLHILRIFWPSFRSFVWRVKKNYLVSCPTNLLLQDFEGRRTISPRNSSGFSHLKPKETKRGSVHGTAKGSNTDPLHFHRRRIFSWCHKSLLT